MAPVAVTTRCWPRSPRGQYSQEQLRYSARREVTRCVPPFGPCRSHRLRRRRWRRRRVAAGAGARQAAAPRVTSPEDVLRPRHRRRLRAAELHQVHRVRAAARQGVRPHGRAVHRQDRRGPRPADGDHHGARELQEARSLQGDLAPPVAGRRAHRRPGARAREGRQGGDLDRRRPARHRGARRAAADRDDLPVREQDRRRDACASCAT